MTGVGIGVLLLPMVGYLLGKRSLRHPGTVEVVSLVASLAGLVAYTQNGYIAWLLALILLTSQIIGAAAAQRAGLTARARPGALKLGAVVSIALGLLIVAASRHHFAWLSAHAHLAVDSRFYSMLRRPSFYPQAALVGFIAGVISEAFDLGGLLLPMAVTFGLGLPPQWAQGTSLAAMVPLYALMIPLRAQGGLIEPQPASWISLGALFGALLGGQWAANALSGHDLLIASAALYCLVGIIRFLQTTPKA
jgi:uncharacterized membrane protein YfcA